MTNEKEIKEQQQQILDKKFEKSISIGYDPEDVDAFFDKVINFLTLVIEYIHSLEEKTEMLNDEIVKLKNEIKKLDEIKNNIIVENDRLKKEGYGNFQLDKEVQKIKQELENLKDGNNSK